jgi:DNA-binding NtrC family response regulator
MGVESGFSTDLTSCTSRQTPTPDRMPVPEPETNHSLARNEELSIQKLLVQFGNRRIVADKLGISERTLYRKLKKHGLDAIAD